MDVNRQFSPSGVAVEKSLRFFAALGPCTYLGSMTTPILSFSEAHRAS